MNRPTSAMPPTSATNRPAAIRALLAMTALTLGSIVGADTPDAGDQSTETSAVSPSLNAYYHGADHERWRRIFESPTREVFARRFEVVKALSLQPGLDVADIGAGTGLYTMLFARTVRPQGKVYAVDISESFVNAIEARTAEYGVDNVVGVVNGPKSANLPADSIDLAFLSDTYHHFEYPRSMLASIRSALRDNGVLAIIDYRRNQGVSSDWVMGHVRAGREAVVDEVRAAGFRFEGEPVKLDSNYFLLFRKVDS